ncbi:uncharacterized protein PADG_11921 [Paracoccidioides brasiliensis Pb18]|uniref:Uncharacterized protein n=1 Tax=Paracoccidioides brasiliensis (strain Pb18) TaxID=502780 RepID=A0A0A0HV75_PARBD|nr:uncharacterized protein PADG_11921 [Paracoccidioides brasiliensis Pb18]KGM91946.1 hypothetical protein PADG_11921 [Paracoccidioides brasiliensis Pb18]
MRTTVSNLQEWSRNGLGKAAVDLPCPQFDGPVSLILFSALEDTTEAQRRGAQGHKQSALVPNEGLFGSYRFWPKPPAILPITTWSHLLVRLQKDVGEV